MKLWSRLLYPPLQARSPAPLLFHTQSAEFRKILNCGSKCNKRYNSTSLLMDNTWFMYKHYTDWLEYGLVWPSPAALAALHRIYLLVDDVDGQDTLSIMALQWAAGAVLMECTLGHPGEDPGEDPGHGVNAVLPLFLQAAGSVHPEGGELVAREHVC